MALTVFIDGAAGTTGLEIGDRLAARGEFEMVVLDEQRRKDADARREALNESDFAILCLPDDAAREAVALIDPASKVRVIDASSAHRTASGWIYGFPEVVGRPVVAGADRISNPGCYSTGFIALMTPLIRDRMLPREWAYSVNAVSGYSGGGKALIGRFEDDRDIAWRGYGLALGHKHIPEMQQRVGLAHPPVFSPAVIPAHRGMVVEVPLPLEAMRAAARPDEMREKLTAYYADSQVVRVSQDTPEELLLRASDQPSDAMTLYVFSDAAGNQARLIAVLDNLGKGASGAAVQSLNLMSGCPETAGLRL
ncbi:N-acetyl-gamma-glutamyl-phosphate reductase [Alteraurantiacibacter aestuarii]|uniref:N-acetyl-gamma-glutamyl-phosphate reductase n=1 Tax=Alteraurantiacibacter aestuarii TaxID=650004 RepID=A0A844ZNM2_9SPHN|nr:N-acetyl-gamma-glutamyl-phosphate reductase [Alteraurantiacibacter aestuarii]MXO88932.1 N-acetyl-gamma-glutamyl-phosphate reductase [Alteraurantiacibacter aestuarii]